MISVELSQKVIGVIPARAASSRFPMKMLYPLLGKPLLYHVWKNAMTAKLLTKVIIATDHELIQKEALSWGADVRMTSEKFQSGTDRAAFINETEKADIVINIQGDEPLITGAVLDLLIQKLQLEKNAQMVTLGILKSSYEQYLDGNVVKIVVASDGRALYFSRASIPVYRDNPEYTFIKHIGIYGYKRDAITTLCQLQPSFLEKAERLEQLRALENNIPIHVVMTETDTHAVDVLEDIAIVEDKLRK